MNASKYPKYQIHIPKSYIVYIMIIFLFAKLSIILADLVFTRSIMVIPLINSTHLTSILWPLYILVASLYAPFCVVLVIIVVVEYNYGI